MILNKSSMERGLCHGSLLKCETLDLREEKGTKTVFAPEPHDARSKVGGGEGGRGWGQWTGGPGHMTHHHLETMPGST